MISLGAKFLRDNSDIRKRVKWRMLMRKMKANITKPNMFFQWAKDHTGG